MTTSSSLPRIVVTVFAIHLCRSGLVSSCLRGRSSTWSWELGAWSLLFHHLDIDLLHVNLLVELWREFGALEELGVDSGRHDCRRRLSRVRWEVDWEDEVVLCLEQQ